MEAIQIDRLPVAQLPSRYDISRTVLYERFAALKIEPERKGNKAYVNAQQLELLDGLHSQLASGGSTLDFLERVGLSNSQSGGQSGSQSAGLSAGLSTEVGEPVSLSLLVEAIARRLSPPDPDPFASFRTLESACQNRWLFSTSHLAQLLELSPTTIGRRDTFERYGFTFTKCGRNGTEVAWRITKGEGS